MRYSQSIVAKQYAKAYLREYGHQLMVQDIDHLKSAIRFFRHHHNFMSLVNLIINAHNADHVLIKELFEQFSLPLTLKKLIKVLIRHKQLIIFAQVLQDICCLYQQQNNVLDVTVYTTTPFQEGELEKFEMFFIKLSGKSIISKVVIDESLIAGVRMQSDFFLWEYSIASRLRKLRQKLLIEG